MFGATSVGVGAIVGGGILALAGVAFATTGPSAILAFGLNGVIAILTALSFAEMASKFPESGGTYTFSRKVLSVESAFTVGWVVWFASIVASVLYAIGFGSFATLLLSELYSTQGSVPHWLGEPWSVPVVSLATTVGIGGLMTFRTSGGGAWINVAKVAVFSVLIIGGFWMLTGQPVSKTTAELRPFLASGWGGLVQAMGYSFIALQGFDLIAAVGGEVREPTKNIPRAMLLSLVIALLIYLPLLFVLTTVGTDGSQSIRELAASDPEAVVALAARHYLGTSGYWLVLIAAVLSMFSALQANLFAASRIALAMSRDNTLPNALSRLAAGSGSPWISVLVTTGLVCLLIQLLPDIAAAGAASSLIFLVTFAIAHWLAILVRQRSVLTPPPFRVPGYPAVPVVGGLACLALAIFQGIAVPEAGIIAVMWIAIGGVLFLSLFARRARLTDVSNIASNPELSRLRGNSPLVLVPIANPNNARAMIALADTLVPAALGRVLVQTVVVAPHDWDPLVNHRPSAQLHSVMNEILHASASLGVRCETLTTVSAEPMMEIARVAKLHQCQSVLLGLSEITPEARDTPLEGLLGQLSSDVVVLRAPKDWQLDQSQQILVPVGGRGGHDYLLTRLLSSLSREQQRQVKFLRVIPTDTLRADQKRIRKELDRTTRVNAGRVCEREVVRSNDPVKTIADRAGTAGLIILGAQRLGPRQKLFGDFTRKVALESDCPVIIISRRG
ncbi:MAG TPA: amino acid permease [Rhodopirellula baltica]|uniref:Cationic amino acid transporter (Cat-1) n=1 Tax=Rhodopirellula baltica (strain DSM 10527 / NCIMB 13988 / SH1) TaxID=243090 RepID=Q7UFY5_RHOBA|nr:amino acid permease [Rhodopirellula baltica]CAD78544.1 cationic amino acid transporter (cat-1) [Rhodopirellula baltica SH 1]HBE61939.1 amino acid permease [Rhodopirellula baltica]